MGVGVGIKYCGGGANRREAKMLGQQRYYGGERAGQEYIYQGDRENSGVLMRIEVEAEDR